MSERDLPRLTIREKNRIDLEIDAALAGLPAEELERRRMSAKAEEDFKKRTLIGRIATLGLSVKRRLGIDEKPEDYAH